MTKYKIAKHHGHAAQPTGALAVLQHPTDSPLLLIGLVAVVTVAVLVLLWTFQPEPFQPLVTGRPSVTIDRDLIDYGTVQFGTPIETVVNVSNVGDQPLLILGEPQVEVIEGCCPPQVEVTRERLNPGNTGQIRLNFVMHDGMGGPHEFRVHVRTNDPREPDKQLTILSNWVP